MDWCLALMRFGGSDWIWTSDQGLTWEPVCFNSLFIIAILIDMLVIALCWQALTHFRRPLHSPVLSMRACLWNKILTLPITSWEHDSTHAQHATHRRVLSLMYLVSQCDLCRMHSPINSLSPSIAFLFCMGFNHKLPPHIIQLFYIDRDESPRQSVLSYLLFQT